jgi:hypothetical protein
MVALIFFLLSLGASLFKPKSWLEAENAALRQQLIVLQRQVRGRVQFTNSDRLFFIQLYRWVSPQGHDDHAARDRDALAACGISSLLALEIAEGGRSAEDRRRFAGIDPADEH